MIRRVKTGRKLDDEDEIEYMIRTNGACFRTKKEICFSEEWNKEYDVHIDAGTYVYVTDYYPPNNADKLNRDYSLKIYVLNDKGDTDHIMIEETMVPYYYLTSYFEQDEKTKLLSKSVKEKREELINISRVAYNKYHPRLLGAFLGSVSLSSILTGVLTGLKYGVLSGIAWGLLIGLCVGAVGAICALVGEEKVAHDIFDITEENINTMDKMLIFDNFLRKISSSGNCKGQSLEDRYIEDVVKKHLRVLENPSNLPESAKKVDIVQNNVEQKLLVEPKAIQNPMGIWIKHDKSELELYKTI